MPRQRITTPHRHALEATLAIERTSASAINETLTEAKVFQKSEFGVNSGGTSDTKSANPIASRRYRHKDAERRCIKVGSFQKNSSGGTEMCFNGRNYTVQRTRRRTAVSDQSHMNRQIVRIFLNSDHLVEVPHAATTAVLRLIELLTSPPDIGQRTQSTSLIFKAILAAFS